MRTLHWVDIKTDTLLWLMEADYFYWAAVTRAKPNIVRIWVVDKFVQQETEYDDLDKAKAVALALVMMT